MNVHKVNQPLVFRDLEIHIWVWGFWKNRIWKTESDGFSRWLIINDKKPCCGGIHGDEFQ
jgi:hypothetical protein